MRWLREPVSKAMRFEVFRRDGHACRICGATASGGAKLHVDHVVPVADGGRSVMSNLQTLCQPCNSGKAARRMDEELRTLEELEAARERLAEEKAEKYCDDGVALERFLRKNGVRVRRFSGEFGYCTADIAGTAMQGAAELSLSMSHEMACKLLESAGVEIRNRWAGTSRE